MGKNRKTQLFIIIPVIITLLFLIPLTRAKINPDLNAYLPDDTPAKLSIERIDSLFGKTDPLMIIFESDDILNPKTLNRIRKINESLTESPEIRSVISIFETKHIRGSEGMMLVDPAIPFVPETPGEKAELKKIIISNPLVYNLLISEDFRFTMMIINAEKGVPDDALYDLLHKILKDNPGNEEVYFAGMPYLRHEIQLNATRDLIILLPVGLIIMMIFLYISFRERRGVILPLAVVIMSTIVAIGLMPLFGYQLSLIAVLTPVLMVSVANNYGVHIIVRYQELNARHRKWTMPEIVSHALSKLNRPIILTGLTTIVGVLGLIVHIMLPARQMGIVSSIGIGFALLLSLTFLPAILARMKKGPIQNDFEQNKRSGIIKLLERIAKTSTGNPKIIITIFAAILIVAGAGIFNMKVSINNEEMMPPSHNIRKATAIANKHFSGTKFISVLFEGDIKDPAVMQTMDRFEQELKQIPEVGNVTSIATVTRLMSKALNNPGEKWYDTIPDMREAIAQYTELYNMSGDPDDFEQLVDFNYEHALLNVQFKAKDLKQFNSVVKRIESLAGSSPYSTTIAGLCLLEKEMAVSIIKGQVWSLLMAMVAIIILLWLIFKAFRAGLLGAVPLVFTLICNFGLMGWIGLELNIATSLLSSIAIGLGVDYTIHLFWRLKQELGQGNHWKEAFMATLTTTGRGITVNALSVIIGFAVLFLSSLVILKSFAFLIIFSLLLCLICTMILMPAILIITKPKYFNK